MFSLALFAAQISIKFLTVRNNKIGHKILTKGGNSRPPWGKDKVWAVIERSKHATLSLTASFASPFGLGNERETRVIKHCPWVKTLLFNFVSGSESPPVSNSLKANDNWIVQGRNAYSAPSLTASLAAVSRSLMMRIKHPLCELCCAHFVNRLSPLFLKLRYQIFCQLCLKLYFLTVRIMLYEEIIAY